MPSRTTTPARNLRRRTYSPPQSSRASALDIPSLECEAVSIDPRLHSLASLVARTLPEDKRSDEFTAAEYVEIAAKLGRTISERSAHNRLNEQVKLKLLETRTIFIDGHTTRVWREVVSTGATVAKVDAR